jgi:ubiquinone/menaquinone biosynthesis C-methylase UbiE
MSLLHDPVGLASLELEAGALVNRAENRRYPIVDGIPALVDQSDLGPQNRKIQAGYRRIAPGFDLADRFANLISAGKVTKARRQFTRKFDLKPGDRCLYVSIGTGLDLPFMAECVSPDALEVVGLDLSMEMLQQCRKRIRAFPASMLVQANAERLPFADHSFDVVVHFGGINLFDRPAEAVKEMARVAKPGALVVIGDETAMVVKNHYQKYNPFMRDTTRGFRTDFDPKSWVPAGAVDVAYEEIQFRVIVRFQAAYFLSFRTAAAPVR